MTKPLPPASLHAALTSLSDPPALPRSLPLVHLSVARWFEAIVAEGRLVPRKCRVFGVDLLYLFYGGAFYRPENHSTENAAELPIAFVFSPRVLPHVQRYFPFDTGAVAGGRAGSWTDRLKPLEGGFDVRGGDHSMPARMVFHIFGSNERYLDGQVDPECSGKPDPLPLLHDYLSSNLTTQGVDHRQTVIECQVGATLSLDAELLWVGFPMGRMGTFVKLCDRIGVVPQLHPYKSHRIFNPYALAQSLESKAREAVIDRYVTLPGDPL